MSLSLFKEVNHPMANVYLNSYDNNMMQGAGNVLKGNFGMASENHRRIAEVLERLEKLKANNENQRLTPAKDHKHSVIETDLAVYVDNFIIENVIENSVETEAFGEDVVVTMSFLAKDYKRLRGNK